MKVAVIGTGYVGLVTGACFSEIGHEVCCVDIDVEKIQLLQKSILPIFEPGLREMVEKNGKAGRLTFTTGMEKALDSADFALIAVGTPEGKEGNADLRFVFQAAEEIGRCMNGRLDIVDKSTAPPGTAKKVKEIVEKQLAGRRAGFPFSVLSNPEFLKEGSAVRDCMQPDRIIIGAEDRQAMERIRKLYLSCPAWREKLIFMDTVSAELTKYAANAMLASRISFMNEIANICERVGADIHEVERGLAGDTRIGPAFLSAGCGYGGSCFPKDVKALIQTGVHTGYEPKLLKAIEEVNENQKKILVQKVTQHFGEDLKDYTFAVWGLSFKPNTDDMREAPSITVIEGLTARGAQVKAYDPKAARQAGEYYLAGNQKVWLEEDNPYKALDGADALILLTEWDEFACPDFEKMRERLRTAVVFDGRNQYDAYKMKQYGFTYYQIGVNVK